YLAYPNLFGITGFINKYLFSVLEVRLLSCALKCVALVLYIYPVIKECRV
uniref:Uncharacterized protein n=1 Tax=Aegilops tauschii subsp. strangulata TaxID=200361 RepID=A0A453I134_AEGTS